jgi:hypothetical protein
MSEAVAIMDTEGNFFMINDAFVSFHRFKSKDEYFRELPDYYDIFELSSLNGNILPVEEWPARKALRGETVRNFEVNIKRKDTNNSWIGSYSTDLVYEDKKLKIDDSVFLL